MRLVFEGDPFDKEKQVEYANKILSELREMLISGDFTIERLKDDMIFNINSYFNHFYEYPMNKTIQESIEKFKENPRGNLITTYRVPWAWSETKSIPAEN